LLEFRRARPESRRSAANRDLVDDIKRVHRDTHGRYGRPRIHIELKAQRRGMSRGRIERLMRHHGIRAIMARPRCGRPTAVTTCRSRRRLKRSTQNSSAIHKLGRPITPSYRGRPEVIGALSNRRE
jgi:transposase InsO family protein